MLKALIFDFDGLILDTETSEADVWAQIYAEHGFDFPFLDWVQTVGGYGISNFDAADHLSLLSQGQLDSASIRTRHSKQSLANIHAQSTLPGVMEMIRDAKVHGLKIAIASSSPHSWVDTHTKRLGIYSHFDKIICSDDVGVGRTKPNPDLFLTALNQLQIQKNEAVVFEDSPNGVKAAHRAGIFVVAVPNSVTSKLNIEGANITARSLAEIPLSGLLDKVQ
ncbi:MAG TPA: HAD family phosphatase [Anaerolineales bacterium]|nr:HAD family phosphatase [Anaerolineales bacterium]